MLCFKIFGLFFEEKNLYLTLINRLNQFCELFRFREEIRTSYVSHVVVDYAVTMSV